MPEAIGHGSTSSLKTIENLAWDFGVRLIYQRVLDTAAARRVDSLRLVPQHV